MKTNTPQLRFKEFTDEWQEKKLGDIVSIFGRIGFRGYTVNDIVLKGAGAIAISPSNIVDDKINYKNNTYISWNKYKESPEIKIYDKDIIFVKTGSTIGKVSIVKNLPERATINPQMVVLKNININNDFLYYLMLSVGFKKNVVKIIVGGAMPTLSQCAINKTLLNLPSSSEQQKIAEFLTVIDEKIEKLEEKKKGFEKYKKGIMQAIFSHGSTSSPQGKMRFKKENGENFPNWEEKKLGEIFEGRAERKGNKNLELLSVTLRNGIIKQSEGNKIDNSSSDTSSYKIVYAGDIVYNTMRMWQGASGLSNMTGYVSPAYTVVFPIFGSNEFYKYLFKQPRVVFDFYRYSQGLTSDTWNLKFNHFSEVAVTVPADTEEQQKIAEFLTALDKKVELINNQQEQTKLFKKSLLRKMFV
jgi:type I restriction enzyme S subunit